MNYEKEINLGSFQWAQIDQGPWKCKHAIKIPKESFRCSVSWSSNSPGGAVTGVTFISNFEKYCFKSRLAEAIERAIDPYIGIKHDRDDDELDDNDEIRSIGVFVNDSESFIKYISRGLFDGCLKLA